MEPTLDLLLRLIRACGMELRMRLEPDNGAALPRSGLDFEARLAEVRNLSAFALDAGKGRGD